MRTPPALLFSFLTALWLAHGSLYASSQHALSLYDEPLYHEGFSHFDYVNPEAPKQGHLRLAIHGSFDSLNPYILKGSSPIGAPYVFRYGFTELNEPLMVGTGVYFQNFKEFGTAYGLIAESVSLSSDRRKMTFTLRPEARFHDGHPITSADVLFSYNILLKKGHPNFKVLLEKVVKVEAVSLHQVRFHLQANISTTLPVRITELPVLPEHYWRHRDFGKTTLEPLLLSGPYKIVKVEPGTSITYEREKNYWGKDLAVNRGLYNFEKVTLQFFRDRHIAFEAFKAGKADAFIEAEAKNWATGYDFSAVRSGQVIKLDVPHAMPYGRRYFAFNLRRERFRDRRVRQAVSQLFDWDWTGRVIFQNAYVRTTSYFPHTIPGSTYRLASVGFPSPVEKQLLSPYLSILPGKILEQPFELSRTRGDGNINNQRRSSLQLLKEAGWRYEKGRMVNARKEPLSFEFLHYSKVIDRFILPFARNLASVGIDMKFRPLDLSQYQRRLRHYDFDMVQTTIPTQYLPDEQLLNYFHSSTVDQEGGRNIMGIANTAADNMIEKALSASNLQTMSTAISALDRILLWEHYAIPNWHGNTTRVAYWRGLRHPDQLPPFGFRLNSWWFEQAPTGTAKEE
ncbi:MAG: extracellular solute-binding protein [Endozoicomonas sp.]